MPNYQNGKIYKIVNDSSNLVYFGSTLQPLYKRFHQHKKMFHQCTSKKILEGENAKIILVEKCPCNDKEELIKRERYYIENNECVNKKIPGRTKKEYRIQNIEKVKKHEKEYYIKNNEKIREGENERRRQEIPTICVCGGSYKKHHKARHEKTEKHINFINCN